MKLKNNYDVIVFGGGTAGTIAAIQAGRSGAETLLVEKNGILGGTLTTGGVNAPAHFFAWGRQVSRGIGWELVRRTLEETGMELPDPERSRDNPRPPGVHVNIPVFAALCDEAVLDAGVDLLFHAMPAAVESDDNGWSVRLCTKTGLADCRAHILVDATGDANVVGLAGFERCTPDVVQPATLVMHCDGYEPDTLDYEALEAAVSRAVADGEMKVTDVGWRGPNPSQFLHNRGHNANHVHAHGAETSEGRSEAELEGRRAMLRMQRFLRRQPALEQFRVESICAELGIRETATIKGKATITVEEYEAGRCYDDALCYAFYPVDEHLNDGQGINWRGLENGVLPTVPRGALLPEGSRNLIVAGRCVSSDREANSGLRVEASCMAMGQAAGAMAALSARTGSDPEALPLNTIRDELRRHDAIVPGDLEA